uniref:hypothetical protein n=1 Tax=Haloprofundus sp. MHR1 TaxID=2572921 RepID=UPI001F3FF3C0|nr:hypothetical protein [Haloprofundus sp. MHR1]
MSASGWDVEESAAVVTAIPGYNENSESTGKARNSAIPVYLDSIFQGDFLTSLPDDLSVALNDEKQLEEYSQSFPKFRLKNGVDIKFNTDGQTVSDYVVLESPASSPITREDGPGESYPAGTKAVFDSLDGSDDYLPSNMKGPYLGEQKVTCEDGDGNVIEGVRGSAIYGGNDSYVVALQQAGVSATVLLNPATYLISDYFSRIPNFYSYVDFILMADGSKYTRVWDASRYPLHALYVNGSQIEQTTFRQGIEWTVDGEISEDNAFVEFVDDSRYPDRTPFRFLAPLNYKDAFSAGFGNHPVLIATEPGNFLSEENLTNEFSAPLLPDRYDGSII